MKSNYKILFMVTVILLTNVFSSPQDTFKIDSRGPDFTLVNIRNDATHRVNAIRETSGNYYLPYMSRMPEFYNKFIVGYFSYDSLQSGWDSVFITVAVINPVTSVTRIQERSATTIKGEIQGQKENYYVNLRGCKLVHPAGMIMTVRNRTVHKSIFFQWHSNY